MKIDSKNSPDKLKKVFVIGDTHFLHNNIIKYQDRPEDFNTLIIANWNKVVKPDDMVIHLGDLAAGIKGRYDLLKKIVSNLNGKRILIRGNHDHLTNEEYINEYGFEAVYDYFILDDILFTHYPLRINEYSKKAEIENVKNLHSIYEKNNLKKVIHGHTHRKDVDLINHFNCSVEKINYTPQEINSFLESF